MQFFVFRVPNRPDLVVFDLVGSVVDAMASEYGRRGGWREASNVLDWGGL